MHNIIVQLCQQRDLAAIIELLSLHQLVTDDINLQEQLFLKAELDNKIIAIGAIEPYPPSMGLIRSVAVCSQYQSQGIAKKICQQLEQQALKLGIGGLYLLTETAEQFFLRMGYQMIERTHVPSAIKQSNQFGSLCPQSAVVMEKLI